MNPVPRKGPPPFRLVQIQIQKPAIRLQGFPQGLTFSGLAEVEADLARFKAVLNVPCPFTHTDLENLEKRICAARECLEELADAYEKVLSRKEALEERQTT